MGGGGGRVGRGVMERSRESHLLKVKLLFSFLNFV